MALLTGPNPGPSGLLSRLMAPLATAGSAAALSAALFVRDPHQQGSWGLCPFKALTGWNCPGCGGLRAVNDLTHGDLAAAAQSNLLFFALVPVAAVAWLLWFRRRLNSREPLLRGTSRRFVGYALVGAAVAFGVVRNTPWGQVLSVS